MPTIRRDDGSQFVIQPYRELFEPTKASALKRKIRALAQNQGENVRIYKQQDSRIEAVFSREPGFLLGETVWDQLGKSSNLIYCEALPERRQALIVIVRNGVVFLDAKHSYANLIDEFAALSTSEEQYDIYTYGDVPLANSAGGGKFVFEPRNVETFTVLEESLLQKLTIDENAQLQPLELALTSPILGKPKVVPITIVAALVICFLVIWHVFQSPPKVPKLRLYQPKPVVNPYLQFYQALATPAPKAQMLGLASTFAMVNSIPGWQVANISYSGTQYSISMKSTGGQITQLQNWAQLNNISYQLQQNGMSLTISSTLPHRSKPTTIYPLRDVLALLLDQLNQMLPKRSISFSKIISHKGYQESNINIRFSNLMPGMLVFIGQALNKYPVTISSIRIASAQDDKLSGTIALTVFGS